MLAASVIVTWTLRHKISKFLGAHSNLQGVCRNLLQFGPVVRSFVFLEVMFFACAAWTLAMTPLARWAVWRKKTDRNTRDVASDSSINSCLCKRGVRSWNQKAQAGDCPVTAMLFRERFQAVDMVCYKFTLLVTNQKVSGLTIFFFF